MSRPIDLTQPLSEEDRNYLLARDRHDLLAQNEAAVSGREYVLPGTEEPESTLDASERVAKAMLEEQDRVADGDKAVLAQRELAAVQEREQLAVQARLNSPDPEEVKKAQAAMVAPGPLGQKVKETEKASTAASEKAAAQKKA